MAKAPQRLRAGFLVHDVSRLRRTAFDQRVKPLGITRSQWWVLANLSRHEGEHMMQIELARLLDVGKVTLGGLVDRLEENGFVVRTPDTVDRRSKRVSVSAKGRALTQKMNLIAMEMNDQIMRGIPPAKQRELEDMLAIMKQNLIEMDAVPSSKGGGATGGNGSGGNGNGGNGNGGGRNARTRKPPAHKA
jgi:DNA-binding MarR family transcriptional regulator